MTPELIRQWLDEWEFVEIRNHSPECSCNHCRLGVVLRHARAMSLEIEAAREALKKALPCYDALSNTLEGGIHELAAWKTAANIYADALEMVRTHCRGDDIDAAFREASRALANAPKEALKKQKEMSE